MVFKPLPRLFSGPVHEKTVLKVHRHSHGHHDADPERRDAGQQPGDQPQRPEELCDNGQEGEDPGDAAPGEEPHRPGEPVPPEPAEHLLRPVREEDDPQEHAQDKAGEIAFSL